MTYSKLNLKAEEITADLVEVMRTWSVFLPNLKLLCFYNDETQHIVVELIYVPISHRRQGICGQILDELTVIARGYEVEIWLEPVDLFGISKQVLSSMYISYGFSWVNNEWMRKQ